MDKKPFSLTLERWWLFLFILVIPFCTFYLTQKPFAISPINIFSLGLILLALYNLFTGVLQWKPLHDKATWWVIGIFFASMAYGLLFTHPLRSGIGTWFSRLIQPCLVGLAVEQLLANGKLKIEELIQALLGSLLLLIGGGVLQVVHVVPTLNPGRISVTYQFPNTFARYVMILLLMGAPWVMQSIFSKESLLKFKYIWLAIWLVGVLLLLGSVSYNGVTSFTLGLVVMLLFLPGIYRKVQAWLLGIIGVIVVLVAANAPKLPKWETSITSSRVTRLQFWQVAIDVLKDHHRFVTGVGLKGWELNYYQYASHYLPAGVPIWLTTSEQPHNVFLDSLLKAGIPGLIGVSLILIWPIWRGIQLIRQNKQAQYFGLSLLGYGVALLAFGFIDDPLWSDDTTPLLFIFFFVAAWLYTEHRNSRRAD